MKQEDMKIKLSISMNPKVFEVIEGIRGDYSRSLAIEAMIVDYLGLEEIQATGYRK